MKRQVRGALQGVRVVELAAIGPVPFACMMLADVGAEIVRVQPPHSALPQFLPPEADPLLRGRAKLSIDLKSEAGRKQFVAIARHADVVLEGFRPGVLERLGIGPDILHAANAKLVIGRMTGWGQDGAYAARAGHDPNYIGLAGVLSCLGETDRPPPLPLNLVGDFGGGGMLLMTGVLAALLHARASGEGQIVDAAMLDGAAMLMTPIYAMHKNGSWLEERTANILDGGAHFGRTYETQDGKYVAVCALEAPFYKALLKGLGLEGETLPAQFDRTAWPEMRERFAAIFKTKTREHWRQIFEDSDACVTPVLSLHEAPLHPHNVSRGVFKDGLPAPAPRFSATPSTTAPQTLGDAAAFLKAWGVGCA